MSPSLQGSAADLIKLAMCAWDDWVAADMQEQQNSLQQLQQEGTQQRPGLRARARLVAQIHDELLFEVDDTQPGNLQVRAARAQLGALRFVDRRERRQGAGCGS